MRQQSGLPHLRPLVLGHIKLTQIGQVWCAFEDFAVRKSRWAAQAAAALATVDFRILECDTQLGRNELLRLTRDRLKTIRSALIQQRSAFERLLAPLTPDGHQGGLRSLIELELSGATALFEQFGNIFRDWAWGQGEITKSLELLRRVTPPDLGSAKVLFLGAGACRVPYEWHREIRPSLTVATEINPLLFLAASELLAGQKLRLSEFPGLPLESKVAAVTHEMAAPTAADASFQLLLSDFCEPVFEDEVFDLVVTDWFIDVVTSPLEKTLRRINKLLRPGGTWINLGPTMFQTSNFADAFAPDEVLWMVGKYGFEISANHEEEVPYQWSPYDGHHRLEKVVCFSAKKTGGPGVGPATTVAGSEPDWLTNTSLPVPEFPGLRDLAVAHQLRGHVLEVVNGRFSIDEIVENISAAGVDLPVGETRAFIKMLLYDAYQKQQPRQVLTGLKR